MKYRFGDCVIDVGARRILRADLERHAEPQVFDLIVFLIENRGRIVGKDELVARIWRSRAVSDTTIASRINAARKAIGDDGRRQGAIETRARQGFRFVAEVSAENEGIGQPSIAVLPLTTLPPDADAQHLAFGLAEQLAQALGRTGWIDVRDPAASFAPGMIGLGTAETGARLDARYLLTGVFRQRDDGVSVSIRLIEAAGGRQVWTTTLDGTPGEVFALQDRMAARIANEIGPRIRMTELERSLAPHGDFTAFEHYLRAVEMLRVMDLPAMLAASVELDKALAASPGYAAAHAMQAWIATLMLPQGRRVDAEAALEHARQALRQGIYDCDALAMAGYALGFVARDPDVGLPYLRRALAVNPSSARAHDHAGWLLLYAGDAEAALVHFDRALVLCPIDEFAFRMRTGRAFALLFLGKFGEAAIDAERVQAIAPDYSVNHRVLVAALAQDGRDAEARRALAVMLKVNPGMRLRRYETETRFQHKGCREILFSGLVRAGLAA